MLKRLVLALAVVCLMYLVSGPAHASHSAADDHKALKITLLDGVSTTTDGVWVAIIGHGRMSIEIDGISDATVTVNVSNKPTQPANSAHHRQLASYSSNIQSIIDGTFAWIKVRITNNTGGTPINAWLVALE